ncbi:DUF5677 domain-containing protein [Hyphomicrobium sp. LHD-15]|uniref:DUF5677 domain-containing protein n=1 Tax=Hyphomicrobium sp. LHD-15 TaxID=3072142 RepID=UPI00280F1836|nr:DUF5677 domain-containing protein [Hyphomicrobium sp. LHD-15]MDQ8700550.1 DUF5677 domain-containing protein [Hyphomicrobium sp. LHD-15]
MLMVNEALAEISAAAKFLHNAWRPVIDHVSLLNMEVHNHLDCVRRVALKRQHDCIKATLALTEVELGETTVPFLRPAVEEYIWCEYFNLIGREKASVLVEHLLFFDMYNTLEAQAAHTGDESIEAMGVTIPRQAFKKIEPEQREKYFKLSKELGFPRPKLDKPKPPSFFFIATKVDHERLYKFLYFATSKTVHFSTHELTRRPWGKVPHFKIKSEMFRDYWTCFALIWGIRLFFFTMQANKDIIIDLPDLDMEEFKNALDAIHKHRHIPIFLAREFGWHPDVPLPTI